MSPQKPETVYVLPEPNPDRTKRLAGGSPPTASVETTTSTPAANEQSETDAGNLEACCSDQPADLAHLDGDDSTPNMDFVSDEVIVNAKLYQEWDRAFAEYTKKKEALEVEEEQLIQELNALSDAFYATIFPADRAALRTGLPEAARTWWPTLFDDETPAQLPDPTRSAKPQNALSRLDQLVEKFEQLAIPPLRQLPH